MTLQIDTFSQEVAARMSNWTITSYSRYDPTTIVAVTPTGKAATITLAGNTITVTVNTRTATRTLAKNLWEAGDLTVTAILDTYNQLPANQR